MADKYLLDDDALILQKLDDDKLYNIFIYLDLPDLLKLEKVSLRFAAVAWQVYRTYKKLDFSQYDIWFSIEKAKEIIIRVGPNIEHLRVETFYSTDVISNFLLTHFPKLQRISLYDCHESMDEQFISNIGILIKRLKNVEIYLQVDILDDFSKDFNEETLIDWLKDSQVESLTLYQPILEGIFLLKLSGFKELNLSGIMAIIPQHFSMYFGIFCTKNPNLQSLNVVSCTWIDARCLLSISKLKNLEVLSVSDNFAVDDLEDYLMLTKLTKLKHFTLCGFEDDKDNVLSTMYIMLLEGISKHNQLESLTLLRMFTTVSLSYEAECKYMNSFVGNLTHLKKVHFRRLQIWTDEHFIALSCHKILEHVTMENTYVSADAVVELIARCPLLKYLKLADCYFDVDGDFIERILPLVKDRNHMLVLEVIKNVVTDSDEDDDEEDDEEEDEEDGVAAKDKNEDYNNSCKKLEDLRELFGIYKGVNSSKLQINYLEEEL